MLGPMLELQNEILNPSQPSDYHIKTNAEIARASESIIGSLQSVQFQTNAPKLKFEIKYPVAKQNVKQKRGKNVTQDSAGKQIIIPPSHLIEAFQVF